LDRGAIVSEDFIELPDNGIAPHHTKIARILIVGAPSAGKTTLAVPLVAFLCPDRERIVCIDHSIPAKLSLILGLPADRPNPNDQGEMEAYFRKLLDKAQKEYPNGEVCMVMDEADLYFSQGARTYGCPALREIAHTGRGCFISQVYISRSPLDLTRSQRGLFNVIFIGKNTEPRAAEWWEDYTGIEGFSEVLRDLPEHRFIVYATDRVPHVLGVAWVENGAICTKRWDPTPGDTEPESSSEPSTDPTSDESAASAESGSLGPSGPDSASSTTPLPVSNSNASGSGTSA
jgi:hypothetical protein